ncbi:hypothetical protein J4225_03710 [Candidatus Pacearchaeota archaeon]|nr:hypothetical protein [Candidatus Pacearchaeota archaeon]
MSYKVLNIKSCLLVIILTFFVLAIFSISIISAIETNIPAQVAKGETIIAKVSGNFLSSIKPENVYFYREHVRVPFPYDVAQINDEFYLYALTEDKQEGNYSIVVKGVEYYAGSQITDNDIILPFSISNKTADFSVFPGFIITKNNFYLKVQNLQNNKINIIIKINPEAKGSTAGFFASLFGFSGDNSGNNNETIISLKSGEIKKINFETNSMNTSIFEAVELSSDSLTYNIPVYIIANKTQPAEETTLFRFDPAFINLTMPTNTSTKRIIYLQNIGQTDLENITLLVSGGLNPYLSLSMSGIDELEAGKTSEAIELSFNSSNEEITIEEEIRAKTEGGLFDYLPITLKFEKNYAPLQNNSAISDYQPSRIKTCEELDGVICAENQTCEGETQTASDGPCCLTQCKEKSKSLLRQTIGWTIVIVLIIFLGWFFKYKYRGAKQEVDLLKTAGGKR